MDATIDINHEDLKSKVWINYSEKNDGLDNDNNGYQDDFSGWNFIGNSDNTTPQYQNYEVVRVVGYYEDKFEKLELDNDLSLKSTEEYQLYKVLKNHWKKKEIILEILFPG